MDIRKITEHYFVSPQLDPSDMEAAKAQGVTTIIANRPDGEVPPSHQADAMQAAAEAAGLTFVRLPITHQSMTPDNVSAQAAAIEAAEGHVLAYCASGTRSTVIWAMGQAMSAGASADEILSAAAAGGYDLSNLRPMLTNLGAS